MNVTGFGNGLVMIFAAIYVAAVLLQGNFMNLLAQLEGEIMFLEWLVVLVILYWLFSASRSWGAAGVIIDGVIGIAVLAVLLKFSPRLNSVLSDFATGKTGLFASIGNLITPASTIGKSVPYDYGAASTASGKG